jgi:hypothetical protein
MMRIEFRNGLLQLLKEDGSMVKLPVMTLSEKDRRFLTDGW